MQEEYLNRCIVLHEREYTTDWMDNEFFTLLQTVDSYVLRYPHDWDGSKELGTNINWDEYIKIKKVNACKFLIKNLVLLPNGDIIIFCADLKSRGVIGNIKEESLFKIYKCKKRQKTTQSQRDYITVAHKTDKE